jgi:DNA-binding IclR family transcriptional regulator
VKRNPYALDSATNALRIIGLLQARHSITVTEVSRELGVGKSTAHRLLMTLVAEDFVVRDPVHRRYHPGRALVRAGLSVLGDFDVRRRASQPMAKLAERTGETVKLLILEGPYARVLEVVEAPQSLRVGGSIGELLPANATAGGKMLLSQETEEALRERFRGRLPKLTEHTISDWDELVVELQAIRQRGWAANYEESAVGVHGLAVPVAGRAVPTLAALTIAAPTSRIPRGQHVEILRQLLDTVASIAAARGTSRGKPSGA